MNTIQNIKVGDKISNIEMQYDDLYSKRKTHRDYIVVGVFPHHVLTRDAKTGMKRSFSYGELVTLGLECQDAEMEEMKANYLTDVTKGARFVYQKTHNRLKNSKTKKNVKSGTKK